jgi:hypothetical protein
MGGIQDTTYEGAVAVTQSDATNDPNGPFAGLYIGVTGDVTITTIRNQKALFKNVPQGTFLRIATNRVWSTGTAATNILGLAQVPYRGGAG